MRLINADALIGDLHNCTFLDSDDRPIVYNVIQKQPTVSGWVSVKDRLPEETESMFARFYATEKWDHAMWKNESETVLVCIRFPDGGRKVTIGRLHDGKWNTTVSKVLPHEVTYWMPLPEPPEEVNEDA